jgi:hypothetical protein
MPPRGLVIAIVVFWIGTSCLLFQRSVLPRWRADTAPAFAIELTDEVGSPQVSWEVFRKDKKIGNGTTQIRRQLDRNFEMSQQFRFEDFKVLILDVRRLDTVYRVTRAGQLLAVKVSGQANILGSEMTADLGGDVNDGVLAPKLRWHTLGMAPQLIEFDPIEIPERGSVLNPMHLVHRLPRLQEGQRWKVPLFDPIKMLGRVVEQKLPKLPFALPSGPAYLEAEVFADKTTWNHAEVECLRVDYSEPGKDRVARTWVRRADGLVLAQDARQNGDDFSIRRVPEIQSPP